MATVALQPGVGQYIPARVRVLAGVSIAAGATTRVVVIGTGGVPASGVSSVAINIAASGTGGSGGTIVYPSGLASAPAVTGVRYRAGVYEDQLMIVGVGADGKIAIKNIGTVPVKIYADVEGYLLASAGGAAGATYVPLPTARVASAISVAANASYTLSVLGAGGVPTTGVSAVAFALIAKGGTGSGKLEVHPSGTAKPAVTAVDYRPSVTLANMVFAVPGSDSKILITNTGSAAVTIYADVAGYFASPSVSVRGSSYRTVTPARIVNSASVAANATLTVAPLGSAGVPGTGVAAVGIQFTVRSTGSGSLRVYPSDQAGPPAGGSVDYLANDYYTQFVPAKLGADGRLIVKNAGSAAISLTLDTFGYFVAATAPPAPSNVVAMPGDGSAIVTWQQPFDGGAAITGSTVTASPGGQTATVPAGQTQVGLVGLTNGTAYTFTVVTTNAVGASLSSRASDPVAPSAPAPPDRPFVTDVYARHGAIRVGWSPPASGVAGLTGYIVRAEPGGVTVQVPASASEAVVTGLVDGTEYTFTVTAVSSAGAGLPSAASAPATPAPAEVPLQPPGLQVFAADRGVDVQWSAPIDGGADITGYTVTATPGDTSLDIAADTTVARITGLTNGTAYAIQVVARNVAGVSEPAVSAAVTPVAARPPGAPTHVIASTQASGALQISWQPPDDAGTSAVTSYTVAASPGGKTTTVSGTSAVITGLTAATAYTLTVVASSAAGAGPASEPTQPLVPTLTVTNPPIVLSDAALATLRSVGEDGSLVFDHAPPEIANAASGTILDIPPSPLVPHGRLASVVQVKHQSSLTLVTTAPAAISDVIGDGDLSVDLPMDSGDLIGFRPATSGVRVRTPTVAGRTREAFARGGPISPLSTLLFRDGKIIVELEKEFEPEHSQGIKVKVEGQIELTPHGKFRGAFHGLSPVVDVTVTTEFKSELRAKVGASLEYKRDIAIGHVDGPCYRVQIGWVPFLICVRADLTLRLSSDGSAGVTVAADWSRHIGAECRARLSGTSCTGIDKGGKVTAPTTVDVYGDGTFEVSAPFALAFLIDHVIGPAPTVSPFLQLKADTTQEPWWELRGGAHLGMELFLVAIARAYHPYQNASLFDIAFTLAKGGKFQGIKVVPEHSQTSVRVPIDLDVVSVPLPVDAPVTWSASGGTIDLNGRFMADSPRTYDVIAKMAATPLHPERTAKGTVTVLGAQGAPTPPRPDEESRPGVGRATVSWRPPVDQGEGPVLEYVVEARDLDAADRSGDRTVYADSGGAATHALISGLVAGHRYRAVVYARNQAGWSMASTPVVLVPLGITFGFSPYGADQATSAEVPRGRPDTTGTAGLGGAAQSGDGSYIFFVTEARSNLAPLEIRDPGSRDTYLVRKDLRTGQIAVVSRGVDGVTPVRVGAGAGRRWLAASRDGNVVAYPVSATQVLVHDIASRVTRSLPGAADLVELSADGSVAKYVQFNSAGTQGHIFRKLLIQSTTTQIDDCASTGCLRFSEGPAMSYDGSKILYYRSTDTANQLKLYDARAGSRTVLFADDDLYFATLNGDGTAIAANWTPPDAPDEDDVVIKGIGSGPTTRDDIVVWSEVNQYYPRPLALSRDGSVLVYRTISFSWNVEGASSLRTRRRDADHDAGGSELTYPESVSITDDSRGLLYTLYNVQNPTESVPGVWYDVLP